MQKRITDKSLSCLYKAFLTAAMLFVIAMSAAAPDFAFAHGGGGGGGGHGEEPGQQETTQEDKETAKNKQKLFWAKQKMSKALNKLIRHQEYMKTKIHSPKTYNYSSEQLVADIREEDKLQKELAARQEEVKKLCSEMDVKPPAEAMLVRPSVLTEADSLAAQHLESEKTTLDMLFDDSKNIQNAEMILGTSDTHGDTPSAGLRVDDRPVWEKTNYDPLDYDFGDPWLDD
ncbi:MAG: hypothetical protein IKT09_04715 [Synergistes sp.]|nr:hypothetical protein [Synergistes sp.]